MIYLIVLVLISPWLFKLRWQAEEDLNDLIFWQKHIKDSKEEKDENQND